MSKLPEVDFKRFEPHLEACKMKLGDVIHKPNEPLRYVYFPENGVVSIVTFLEDGSNIETGIIGTDGVVGTGIILSDDVSPRQAIVQVSGTCLRMKADIFRQEFDRGGELNRLARRFVYAFIAQISQNAACNNRHRIELRLARWLLMLHDSIIGDKIVTTQEFVAQMLGTNRPSVSENAGKLQKTGIIKSIRGQITILDRKGLEGASCECYQAIKVASVNYLNN